MKYAAPFLLLSLTAYAQDMKLTEVHGHMLGESLKAYVSRTPHGEEQVQKCRVQITKHRRPSIHTKGAAIDFSGLNKQQAFDECAALVAGVDTGGRLTFSSFE